MQVLHSTSHTGEVVLSVLSLLLELPLVQSRCPPLDWAGVFDRRVCERICPSPEPQWCLNLPLPKESEFACVEDWIVTKLPTLVGASSSSLLRSRIYWLLQVTEP